MRVWNISLGSPSPWVLAMYSCASRYSSSILSTESWASSNSALTIFKNVRQVGKLLRWDGLLRLFFLFH